MPSASNRLPFYIVQPGRNFPVNLPATGWGLKSLRQASGAASAGGFDEDARTARLQKAHLQQFH